MKLVLNCKADKEGGKIKQLLLQKHSGVKTCYLTRRDNKNFHPLKCMLLHAANNSACQPEPRHSVQR